MSDWKWSAKIWHDALDECVTFLEQQKPKAAAPTNLPTPKPQARQK
jgi:hypothetical protein